MKTHNFEGAMYALKSGKLVRRVHWDFGTFLYKQVDARIEIEDVPKMKSLPQSVKSEFLERGKHIEYKNQYCIFDISNIITAWSASKTDEKANDWIIYE